MTDYQNTYETGLAAGTALTTTNSDDNGAGDQFSIVTGGTQQYTATNVLHGTRSVTIAAAASTAAYHAWNSMTGATSSFALDMYFYMPSQPVTNDQVLGALYRGASGVSPILIRTNGALRMTSDAGGGAQIVASASGIFTTAGHYRVSIWGTANGASGTVNMRAWSVDAGTKVETEIVSTVTSNTANLGTGNVDSFRIGRSVNFGPAYTWTMNVVRFRTGAATPFTAFSSNAAPDANAGPDQTVEPWTQVTLDATASTDDVGIASFAWSQTAGSPTASLSNANTSTATLESPGTIAGTTQTFQVLVTDTGGLTDTDTVVITTRAATERAWVGGVEVPMRVYEV